MGSGGGNLHPTGTKIKGTSGNATEAKGGGGEKPFGVSRVGKKKKKTKKGEEEKKHNWAKQKKTEKPA